MTTLAGDAVEGVAPETQPEKRKSGWAPEVIEKAHSPLANALRALRWAEKDVKKVDKRHERDKARAEARLRRAKARVEYERALEETRAEQ